MIHLTFHTKRLIVKPLADKDHAFILELLNTEGWIKFIGNRNVNSKSDALAYIQKINENPNTHYYIVSHKETLTTVGLVTLIQRDYLKNPDVGFAFLPQYMHQGFAFESASRLIDELTKHALIEKLSAVTFPNNTASIKLLRKLGFNYEKTIENEGMTLNIYNKILATDILN